MIKSTAYVALIIGLLAAASIGGAQTLKADLQARYRAFARAIRNHDNAYLQTHLSKNFTAHFPNGKTANREETLKGFNDLMNSAKDIRWTFDLSDLEVAPNGVRVKARGHMSASAVTEDKKKHSAKVDGLTADTWTFEGNHWVLSHVEFLKLEATLDGKPAPVDGIAP